MNGENMEQKKEMTTKDAWIAMANGECVKCDDFVHRIREGSLEFWDKYDWCATTGISRGPYSIVPDPSKPVDEIEELHIKFAEFVDENIGGKYEPEQDLSQGDLIDMLLEFTHKNYVKKEP